MRSDSYSFFFWNRKVFVPQAIKSGNLTSLEGEILRGLTGNALAVLPIQPDMIVYIKASPLLVSSKSWALPVFFIGLITDDDGFGSFCNAIFTFCIKLHTSGAFQLKKNSFPVSLTLRKLMQVSFYWQKKTKCPPFYVAHHFILNCLNL